MKYNILDFNQEAVLSIYKIIKDKNGKDRKIALDVSDLLIIQVIADIIHRDKFTKQIIDDKLYYWITYNLILEDLPILNIKKQALSDRINKMVELGILEKKVVMAQGQGTFTSFRLTGLYEKIKYSTTSYYDTQLQEGGRSQLQEGGRSQLQGGVVVNYEPKDYNNTNNSSTNKQNKEIYKEIVDFWNENTKSFAKVHVISEKIKSAINSRIRDGYSVDDIKKAILLCESLPDFYKGGDSGKLWKASFMWLISNTKGNFDSILSGALHNSPSAKRDYDMIINLGDKAYKEAYTPSCDGISLFWNDNVNAYCTTNNPEWGVYDGYKPNERPNGATVYCQGVYYSWNLEKKEWKRKPLNHE